MSSAQKVGLIVMMLLAILAVILACIKWDSTEQIEPVAPEVKTVGVQQQTYVYEPPKNTGWLVENLRYDYEDHYLISLCEPVEDAQTGTIVRHEEIQVTHTNAPTSDYTASQEPIYVSTDEEWLLAWIIYMEAGSYWIPDYVQQYVGSVVLNRVASSKFPNTITDVLYQPGQYYAAMTGLYYAPDDRAKANARYLLENGSVLPADVLFQANFTQGTGVYHEYQDPYLGSSYFCYG